MSELPEGWAIAMLDDLFDHRSGNSKIIKGKQASEPGPGLVPAFSASGQDIWATEAEHEGHGLVISAVGARCGKVFRVAEPAWTAVANTHVLKPVTTDINPDFWWYLVNDEDWWVRSGSAQPFVKVRDSLQRTVGVPPLPEQRRIVAAIEEAFSKLDAGEAGLRTVRQLLKRMRDSILTAAVTGRLVPQDPTDTPATKLLADLGIEPLDRVELPLPGGWSCARLGELAAVVSGNTPRGLNEAVADSGDLPLIKVGDLALDEKYLTTSRTWISHANKVRLRLRTCPAGTIIFPKRGGAIATNRKRILGREAAFDLNTMGLVPKPVVGDWLWTWFGQLDLRTISDGSNVPQLNHSDVDPLVVPVPPPEEQVRLVAEVDRQMSFIAACERAVDAGLARAAALRRSVLKAAFEGKLVPQDPTDEPASVLLERIRADRAAAPKTKTRRAGPKA